MAARVDTADARRYLAIVAPPMGRHAYRGPAWQYLDALDEAYREMDRIADPAPEDVDALAVALYVSGEEPDLPFGELHPITQDAWRGIARAAFAHVATTMAR